MQKESYDIERVQRYFFFYLFRSNYTKYEEFDYKNNSYRQALINKTERTAHIFLLIGILALIIGIYVTLNFVSSNESILTYIILIGPAFPIFYIGLMQLKIIHNYKQIQIYFSKKQKIIDFLDSLKVLVVEDIIRKGIDLDLINEIGENIKELSKLVKIINVNMKEISGLGKHLLKHDQMLLEDFLSYERAIILDYIIELHGVITNWLDIHETELFKYKGEIFRSENATVQLATTRLSSHIENLEKVRVML